MNHKLIVMIMFVSLCHAGLIRPGNGEELHYIHVLFEWDQEPNADAYNLQFSNSESFSNILLDVNEATTVYVEKNIISWENTYYWRVRPIYDENNYGEWNATSYFTTGASIFQNFNASTIIDEIIEDDLIIFGQISPFKGAGVVDKYGNEIWNMEGIFLNSVNEFGQLFGGYLAPPYIGMEFNFEKDTVWHTPIGGGLNNHEFIQIPNGNYMILINKYQLGPVPPGDWRQSFQNAGYLADGITNEFTWRGHRIVEFDKDTKEQVWDWNAFDHFSMDDYDVYGGTWNYALHKNWYDWLHGNAFYFDAEESVIYVSFRSLSRITKIAYPSGDVIWNMGLPEKYGTGDDNICTDLLFSFQHHIQVLENGDLLFFDNGNLSEMLLGDPYPTTRIRRIRVVDDSECETVWQYNLPLHLYARAVGSVQHLDNGNYFVNTMGTGRGSNDFSNLEITPNKEILWELTSEVNTIWYRSFKIPSLHPDAFAVVLDHYYNVEFAGDSIDGIILDDRNPNLSFTIYNKSGFSQPYIYLVSDANDWFNESIDTVFINAYGQHNVVLQPTVQSYSVNTVILEYWPLHHVYAKKSMNMNIFQMYRILSEEENNPDDFILFNNYPNPFNPITTIRFSTGSSVQLTLQVFDISGKLVETLVDEPIAPGIHELTWHGDKLPSGVYFVQLKVGSFVQSRKMVLLK